MTADNKLAKPHSGYFDIDGSPTKDYFIQNRDIGKGIKYFIRTVGFRPYEELYNIKHDPGCLDNLVGCPKSELLLNKLRKNLDDMLDKTNDVRVTSELGDSIWESYPRRDFMRNFANF